MKIDYIGKAIFQPERTVDEAGKQNIHIQGAMYLKKGKKKSTLLNDGLMKNFHYLMPMTSSYINNMKYCTKEESAYGDVFSIGDQDAWIEKEKSDKVSQAKAWNEAVNANMPEDKLKDEHPAMWWKTSTAKLERAIDLNQAKEEQKIEPKVVNVYWGEPGCGKSTKAGKFDFEKAVEIRFERGILYVDARYDPRRHDTIVLDEFTGDGCKVELFKAITDQGIPIARILGGTKRIMARKWNITSNVNPKTWFSITEWPAIKRRLNIIKCKKDPSYEAKKDALKII